MSNDTHFITAETLAIILVIYARSFPIDSSDSVSKVKKACESLEIICEPLADVFNANTGKQVIPWGCDDINRAYLEQKYLILTDRDFIVCEKRLLGMPGNWISNDGRDFSRNRHFQALALILFGIGHLLTQQNAIIDCL
ncbi:MAG: hypothetical protein QM504_05425 [Pseudomonadota bacterium]